MPDQAAMIGIINRLPSGLGIVVRESSVRARGAASHGLPVDRTVETEMSAAGATALLMVGTVLFTGLAGVLFCELRARAAEAFWHRCCCIGRSPAWASCSD